MNDIVNAKISSTMLGYEDHGLMTCMLTLEYGSYTQGFGGYCLGKHYTDQWVQGLLKAVGVNSWEQLKGKYVRIKKPLVWNGRIEAVGNLIEDIWFDPSELPE